MFSGQKGEKSGEGNGASQEHSNYFFDSSVVK